MPKPNTTITISHPQTPTPAPYYSPNYHYAAKKGDDPILLKALYMIQKNQSASIATVIYWMLSGISDKWVSPQTKLNIYHFLNHLPLLNIPIPIPLLLPFMFFWFFIVMFLIFLSYKLLRHVVIPVSIFTISVIIPAVSLLIRISGTILGKVLGKKGGIKMPAALASFGNSIGNIGGLGKNKSDKAFLELTFPSDTNKSAYATSQLYLLLHTRARMQGNSSFNLFSNQKKTYSLEITSSRDNGIRFFLVVPVKEADVMSRSLLSYLPGLKIRQVPDYLDTDIRIHAGNIEDGVTPGIGIVELKLSSDIVLPLQNQNVLAEHDPISFLTGAMTKLSDGELIAFQVVTTPLLDTVHGGTINHIKKIKHTIARQLPIAPMLNKGFLSLPFPSLLLLFLAPLVWLIILILKVLISIPASILDSSGKSVPIFQTEPKKVPLQELLNPYEQQLQQIVKEKTDQHLFETSIRVFMVTRDHEELDTRSDKIITSFGQFDSAYQSFTTKGSSPLLSFLPFISKYTNRKRVAMFKQRTVSGGIFNQNPILSTSEMSDLFHFPYTDITKVEGLVKSKSNNLPAPLSFKRSDTSLDVVVGKNTYGGEETPIGQTLTQRRKHTYIIGKTGMGKTEMLKNLIYQDMESGKGLCVLDPHGDLFYELLRIVPKNRRKDVVVFNPADKEYPIGLNILSSGITFTDLEEGQDWITSSIVAVFQKVSDPRFWGPRLEHILRNAAMTALTTSSPSLFTIQRLLTDTKGYQKRVSTNLSDPVLKQFWDNEFSLFGKMQQADAVSPITNKVGKFITSKKSRNILLQKDSTFNIQRIMDEGKILLVNLSKGEIGEDHSHFFGSLIISLIQLAAYQRIHVPENQRRDFFLYVDEFQNFATHIFEDISSEGRKFHTPLITSHQNIAQIKDPYLLQIVAGNADSFIAMKAGPDDEKFILPFMEPEVEKGSIVNLPPYKFFMKVTNDDSEDAFSGETQLLDIKGSDAVAKEVIEYSRKHYATPRKEVEKYLEKLFTGKYTQEKVGTATNKTTHTNTKISADKTDKTRGEKGGHKNHTVSPASRAIMAKRARKKKGKKI